MRNSENSSDKVHDKIPSHAAYKCFVKVLGSIIFQGEAFTLWELYSELNPEEPQVSVASKQVSSNGSTTKVDIWSLQQLLTCQNSSWPTTAFWHKNSFCYGIPMFFLKEQWPIVPNTSLTDRGMTAFGIHNLNRITRLNAHKVTLFLEIQGVPAVRNFSFHSSLNTQVLKTLLLNTGDCRSHSIVTKRGK